MSILILLLLAQTNIRPGQSHQQVGVCATVPCPPTSPSTAMQPSRFGYGFAANGQVLTWWNGGNPLTIRPLTAPTYFSAYWPVAVSVADPSQVSMTDALGNSVSPSMPSSFQDWQTLRSLTSSAKTKFCSEYPGAADCFSSPPPDWLVVMVWDGSKWALSQIVENTY